MYMLQMLILTILYFVPACQHCLKATFILAFHLKFLDIELSCCII